MSRWSDICNSDSALLERRSDICWMVPPPFGAVLPIESWFTRTLEGIGKAGAPILAIPAKRPCTYFIISSNHLNTPMKYIEHSNFHKRHSPNPNVQQFQTKWASVKSGKLFWWDKHQSHAVLNIISLKVLNYISLKVLNKLRSTSTFYMLSLNRWDPW